VKSISGKNNYSWWGARQLNWEIPAGESLEVVVLRGGEMIEVSLKPE
jgi:hypothetical protein